MSLTSDIITQAFLDLGAISPFEGLNTSEQTDALLRLNQMLASWSTEGVTVFNRIHQSVSLTAAQATYTLGLAADGATLPLTSRPVRIAGVSFASGLFRKAAKMLSFEKFSALVDDAQGLSASMPEMFVYDNSFPLINVRLFPLPNSSATIMWLDYWAAITALGISDTINMPPGYEDALHFNLALRLQPQYGRANGVDPALVTMAGESKAAIVKLNAEILGLMPAPPPPAAPPAA